MSATESSQTPATAGGGGERPRAALGRRALYLAPLGVAAAGGLGFWAMLRGLGSGEYNPRGVPSVLVGRAPPLDAPLEPLASVPATPTLRPAADLRAPGRPVLVNFWASWCAPCVIEHPFLMRLAREDGVPVFGIAHRDRPEDAAAFLARRGNPFARLAADPTGRAAVEWGVYGVPETYLVDPRGAVRWRWAGPVTEDVLAADLRPLLRRYAA